MFGIHSGIRIRRSLRFLGLAACALLLTGCGGRLVSEGDGGGEPLDFTLRSLPEVAVDTTLSPTMTRHYLTGTVPVAVSTNTFDQGKSVLARVEAATGFSDCFVARPRADWDEWGPEGEGKIGGDFVAATNLVRERGIDCIVFEIDPVSDRRKVGVLPPELAGMNFADEEVREPIKRMAVQFAVQLRPTYLSIGVEMNGYYESEPEDFLNYVNLHKETYDAVKAAAPEVQFIAAFNLEAIQGFYAGLDEFSGHEPQWFLLDMLEPKLDAVAFSTLPFSLYIRPVLLPDDYLSRIELHTSRDILLSEIGWPGNPNAPVHTYEAQTEYLARMVRLLENTSRVRLVVWTSLFDPDLGSPDDLHVDFQALGLVDNDNHRKPAFTLWEQIHNAPYEP